METNPVDLGSAAKPEPVETKTEDIADVAADIVKESYPHIVQVYARYSGNIVSLSWKPDPVINEYRLYRGTDISVLSGYFTIFDAGVDEDDFLDFNDDGTGILNEFNTLQL